MAVERVETAAGRGLPITIPRRRAPAAAAIDRETPPVRGAAQSDADDFVELQEASEFPTPTTGDTWGDARGDARMADEGWAEGGDCGRGGTLAGAPIGVPEEWARRFAALAGGGPGAVGTAPGGALRRLLSFAGMSHAGDEGAEGGTPRVDAGVRRLVGRAGVLEAIVLPPDRPADQPSTRPARPGEESTDRGGMGDAGDGGRRYRVRIGVPPLTPAEWTRLVGVFARAGGPLADLLGGRAHLACETAARAGSHVRVHVRRRAHAVHALLSCAARLRTAPARRGAAALGATRLRG